MTQTAAGRNPEALAAVGLLDQLARAPFRASLGAVIAVLVLYLASLALLGGPAPLADPSGSGLNTGLSFNFALLLILGFTLWAGLRERQQAGRELDALRPVLRLSDPELRVLRRELRTSPASSGLALLCGGLAGVALHLLGRRVAAVQHVPSWGDLHSIWNLIVIVLLFAAMGQRVRSSLASARRFSDLGRRHTEVRLLAPESLTPFGLRGLRLASYWFGGSALALLLFVDAASAVLVASVIGVTFSLGVFSLLLPCLGIRERIRAVKKQELDRVRAVIEQRGAALLAGGAEAADPGLASLIAYEARIEDVREWPLDTPTLGRFALFLLIPIGSWLGGAMVERLVDAALG